MTPNYDQLGALSENYVYSFVLDVVMVGLVRWGTEVRDNKQHVRRKQHDQCLNRIAKAISPSGHLSTRK